MLTWPALLLAPLLALGQLSLAYALVSPACSDQDSRWLHASTAACLAITLLLTLAAWVAWRRSMTADDGHVDGSDSPQWSRFAALVAVLMGGFSSLVVATLWIPQWLLSPCLG